MNKLANVPFEVQSLKQLVEFLSVNTKGNNRAFNFVNVHSLVEATENIDHLVALTGDVVNLPDGFQLRLCFVENMENSKRFQVQISCSIFLIIQN